MAKILLVEPPDDVPRGLKPALLAAGFEVEPAPAGSFALTTLEWNRPDIIVSRVHLGDMDGFELCSIIRSDPKTKDIPFVLLGSSNGSMVRAATEAGVDLVLGRDFNSLDLIGIVQRLL